VQLHQLKPRQPQQQQKYQPNTTCVWHLRLELKMVSTEVANSCCSKNHGKRGYLGSLVDSIGKLHQKQQQRQRQQRQQQQQQQQQQWLLQ